MRIKLALTSKLYLLLLTFFICLYTFSKNVLNSIKTKQLKGEINMLKITNFKNGAKQYEEMTQKVLELAQQKLNFFGNEEIKFVSEIMEGYTYDIKLTSEPLPVNLLGVWAYAVQEMRLVVQGSISKDKKETYFGFGFRYVHREGGGNGAGISNLGESSFGINYNMKTGTAQVITRNNLVSNSIRTLEIYLHEHTKIIELVGTVREYLLKDELSDDEIKEFLVYLQQLKGNASELLIDEEDLSKRTYDEIVKALAPLKKVIEEYEHRLKNTK